jgi:hypothetical protein
MDRTTLLKTIQQARTELETLLAPLSEEQLCRVPANEQWSIKDILVHVAVWEQICARWLDEFARGITPQPSERNDLSSNERIYRAHRDRSLAEVRDLFASAHQQFLRQVEQLTRAFSEEDWNASDRFPWTASWPGHSLLAVIADNSYEHYADHEQHIRSLLAAL